MDSNIKTLKEIKIPESDRHYSILHTITSAALDDRNELSIFLQRFPYMTSLSHLTIYNMCFSDDDVAALAKALPPKNALVALNLSNNQIGDPGAISLAEMLSNMKKLTLLDLHNNKIGSVGAQALVEKQGDVTIHGILVPKSKNREGLGLKLPPTVFREGLGLKLPPTVFRATRPPKTTKDADEE